MALSDRPAERHREISRVFTDRVRSTRSWDLPSPVAGWTARDVVRHLAATIVRRGNRAARSGSGARSSNSWASPAARSSNACNAAGKNSRSAERSRSTCRVRSQIRL